MAVSLPDRRRRRENSKRFCSERRARRRLLRRQPGVAADQDQLAARIGLSEVSFEDRPVVGREVAENLGNAAVLA